MLQYIYTHTGTEATTGYFSSEPSPPPRIEDGLRYLAAHPMDDFMRRHLIRRMTSMAPDAVERALTAVLAEGPSEALTALARELALLHPGFFSLLTDVDEKAANNDESTSLIFLRWRELPHRDLHRQWGLLFNANMQQHRALQPPQETGLPPLYPAAHVPDATGVPGTSAPFTEPFRLTLQDVFPQYRERQAHPPYTRPPSAETAALAEERLHAYGVIADREMRHTSSLSPVALLRPWNIRLSVDQGRHAYTLEGKATTYGRGLSVADARASCLMEMVERASSYLSVADGKLLDRRNTSPIVTGSRSRICDDYGPAIDPNEYPLEAPYKDEPLVWMRGASCEGGETYVPVQMAGLFCNLDEIALYDSPGSTGIATGCTMEEAKLAALLEILERDAEATTPFSKTGCFRLEADEHDDPLIAALLADYAARGINVQFQNLTGPLGVPVYKCFVMTPKGQIARGHGAGLSAGKAVISALTECPFPYPDGGPSGPMLRKLPCIKLGELPDYSLTSPALNLAMLEELLCANGRPPVYVDLTHEGLRFPVVRALIPGMELAADRDAFSHIPLRLWNTYRCLFAA